MKEILIDGAKLSDRESAYSYLFDALDAVFGRNLDALHDVLTDLADADIIFENLSAVSENLGEYGERLITCFKDSAEENTMIKVIFK